MARRLPRLQKTRSPTNSQIRRRSMGIITLPTNHLPFLPPPFNLPSSPPPLYLSASFSRPVFCVFFCSCSQHSRIAFPYNPLSILILLINNECTCTPVEGGGKDIVVTQCRMGVVSFCILCIPIPLFPFFSFLVCLCYRGGGGE